MEKERLKELYAEWREASEEAMKDLPGSVDCGEDVVREDFSYFADLENIIEFEDMLELEEEYEAQYEEKESETMITVETNPAENYFYASEALEDEGYKEVGIAYTTDGDFEIYRKDGEEFYFVGMNNYNATIYEVYLEPLEKLNYYNRDYFPKEENEDI